MTQTARTIGSMTWLLCCALLSGLGCGEDVRCASDKRTCLCTSSKGVATTLCVSANTDVAGCQCSNPSAASPGADVSNAPAAGSTMTVSPGSAAAGQAGSSAPANDPAASGRASGSAAGSGGSSSSTPTSSAGKGAGAGRSGTAAASSGGSGPAAAGVSGPASLPAAGSGGTPAPSALVILSEPMDDASYLFDQAQLRTYDIQVAPADIATIDAHPSLEQTVPAMVTFEGKTYGPYGVRYKGSNGSFKFPCTTNGFDDPKAGKCSMKLDFNESDPEGRFFGLKKLNFHAMNTDASMLRDRLGYAMFRESGIAAPRAAHARVLINGKLEGLFALVEQIDGRFTRARFNDGGEGNVYKEVWPLSTDASSYTSALETNEEKPSVTNMLAFQAAVAKQGSLAAFLDIDYLGRYVAVDRVIMNDDGMFHFYCDATDGRSWNHNFYWYETGASPLFWMIPWDLDHSFEGSPWVRLARDWKASASCSCAPNGSYGNQKPSSCDPLVKELIGMDLSVETAMDAFLAGPFARDHVLAKLNAWGPQIRPSVVEAAGVRMAPAEAEWAEGVMELTTIIDSLRQNRGYRY